MTQGAGSGGKDCGDLRIAVNPWTGYVANAHVIGVVAQEELGCNVTYPEVKEEVGWQGMADGSIDTDRRELGPPRPDQEVHRRAGSVEDAGLTGNEGLIGWFVPQWMADEYPDILDWENLNKYADMFKTSESGGKGQLLDGDPSYVTNDEALVKNLDLNYQVVVGGSEAALLQSFRSAEENKTPLLAYFYTPQWYAEVDGRVDPGRRGPGPDRARGAAALHRGLRRRPGCGRLRLPAVPPEQADLDQVRRLRLARRWT